MHQALYGFSMDAPAELVTLRVEATGKMHAPAMPQLAPAPMPMPIETRLVHFAEGSKDTAVLARDGLGAGLVFDGPAIITQLDATTLIPPGWRVEIHAAGSMLLRRRA